DFGGRAQAIPAASATDLAAAAVAHCGLLAASLDLLAPQPVVVIKTSADPEAERLARAPLRLSLPGAVQQTVPASLAPRVGPLAGKSALAGRSAGFACIGPQCSLPVSDAEEFLAVLRRQRALDGATLSTMN